MKPREAWVEMRSGIAGFGCAVTCPIERLPSARRLQDQTMKRTKAIKNQPLLVASEVRQALQPHKNGEILSKENSEIKCFNTTRLALGVCFSQWTHQFASSIFNSHTTAIFCLHCISSIARCCGVHRSKYIGQ